MKTFLKKEWLQLVILAVPFCVAGLLWAKLPARMPIHWNIHNQVDGYAGRAYGALFVPFVNIGVALLIGVLALIDPKLKKNDPAARNSTLQIIRILRLTITGFLSAVACAVIAASLGVRFNMGHVVGIGTGLLFVVLGNFMGKLRPNYFAGIRTPWTLESKTVWMKTHRVGGVVMVLGGICMVLGSILVRPELFFTWVSIPITVLITLVCVGYSYVAYRAEKRAGLIGRRRGLGESK